MQTPHHPSRRIGGLSAVTVFAAAVLCSLGVPAGVAQLQTPVQAQPQLISPASMNFRAYMTAPADTAAASDSAPYSSSSNSSEALPPEPGASASLMGGDASQPPPRRRYGRPNYSDSHTNADGSAKWTFVAGGGFNVPVSTTSNDLTTGYRFQVGGGRNFNKKFGVLLQFDYDHFGFQTSTLRSLLTTYNNEIIEYNEQNPGANIPLLTNLGGTSHDWSFTINPVYNVYQGDNIGAYVVAGAGFYHKVADFTVPTTGTYCDYYYGYCYQYQANQVIDQYISNAPGFNGGAGITYKFSRFTSERLFAEVRYVYTVNSERPFSDTGLPNNPNYYNVFPQNSYHTTYLPITFGIRF